MKKTVILIIALLFAALCVNVFAQNATAFNVKKTGKGNRSIIFIPGFACSGDVWKETTPLFEKDFTCYTLTMPGFAGQPAEADPSFKGWEDAIAGYIKKNNIDKPIIIGHSMGGGLALALASDYPDVIGKIVVVDALPCLSAIMNKAFKSKENNDCSPVVKQFTAMSDSVFLQMQKHTMPRLVAETSKVAQVVEWSMLSDRKTFAQMYCDFSNTDLREKIATIKCPSLILLEQPFSTLTDAINDEYKNLKTGQLVYATKGLHFIMYDDTAWFNQQITRFTAQ
ncbi:alpha/beta fold hydrolase [Chitinophagaceae bacterium LWZ2-11]